jgi:hypothetical protein
MLHGVINSGVLVIIIVHLFALTAIKELYRQKYLEINRSTTVDLNPMFHFTCS